MIIKKIKLTLIVFGLTIAGGYAFLKYAFWEPSNLEAGSIAYILKIPDYAKKFPVWRAHNTPLYSYRIADGDKSDVVKIRYVSESSCLSLLPNVKNINATCKESSHGYFFCRKNANSSDGIDIVLKNIDDGCQIEIDIIGGEYL